MRLCLHLYTRHLYTLPAVREIILNPDVCIRPGESFGHYFGIVKELVSEVKDNCRGRI
jgi:hypothetical protein